MLITELMWSEKLREIFIFTNIMNEVNVIMYIYEMVERLSSRKM